MECILGRIQLKLCVKYKNEIMQGSNFGNGEEVLGLSVVRGGSRPPQLSTLWPHQNVERRHTKHFPPTVYVRLILSRISKLWKA